MVSLDTLARIGPCAGVCHTRISGQEKAAGARRQVKMVA